MTNNCPVCGNDQNVYQIGYDGTWGRFVLCSIRGMQVCEQQPERAKYQGGTGQRAYPRMGCLDGGIRE
jgi:hypothetical protein